MAAATCVLGSQCLLIAENRTAALVLWCLGVARWALLVYGIFTMLMVREADAG